ncbi:MAG: serine protease [Terracidiphilus sp.]
MKLHGLALLSFVLAAACVAESPRELAERGFKSVVLLAMSDSNGQPLCIGSGFFVSDDVVATNAHVIQGAWSGSAKLVGQSQTFQVLGVLAVDAHADLALLKVSGKAPLLGLSRGPAPAVGDSVYVIGSPLGLEGTFSEGIISGVRTMGTDSLIQMTAPISPGSSGGPVMDAAGEVVGVAVATFNEGQNLNLAVPVAYLERMLDAHPAALAPLQSASPRANAPSSIVDGLGTRAEEGVIATDFRSEHEVVFDNIQYNYRIRLTNRLPVIASHVVVVIAFYDGSGKMLNFDQLTCEGPILAGLTRDFLAYGSSDCSQTSGWWSLDEVVKETMDRRGHANFTTSMRVIGFKTGESQN